MHEGNTEEENNGYVVFNPRISWDREALLRQPPLISTAGFWADISRRHNRFFLLLRKV
jgi:hypothetical protein